MATLHKCDGCGEVSQERAGDIPYPPHAATVEGWATIGLQITRKLEDGERGDWMPEGEQLVTVPIPGLHLCPHCLETIVASPRLEAKIREAMKARPFGVMGVPHGAVVPMRPRRN